MVAHVYSVLGHAKACESRTNRPSLDCFQLACARGALRFRAQLPHRQHSKSGGDFSTSCPQRLPPTPSTVARSGPWGCVQARPRSCAAPARRSSGVSASWRCGGLRLRLALVLDVVHVPLCIVVLLCMWRVFPLSSLDYCIGACVCHVDRLCPNAPIGAEWWSKRFPAQRCSAPPSTHPAT